MDVFRGLKDLAMLKGRMPRLPFIAWTVAGYVAFFGFALIGFRAPDFSLRAEIALSLCLLSLVVKFMAVAARLHDVNGTALIAAPSLIMVALGVYNHFIYGYFDVPEIPFFYSPAFGKDSEMTIGDVFGGVMLTAIPVTDLVLMVLPGSKVRNRFGQPAGKEVLEVTNHF